MEISHLAMVIAKKMQYIVQQSWLKSKSGKLDAAIIRLLLGENIFDLATQVDE